jgi:hypothetical protein
MSSKTLYVKGTIDSGELATTLNAQGSSYFFYLSYSYLVVSDLKIIWTNIFVYIGGSENTSHFNISNVQVQRGSSCFFFFFLLFLILFLGQQFAYLYWGGVTLYESIN